jgi:putative PIN family toxin of toxin-antitoxin system
MIKAVLDTNTLVSARFSPNGVCGQILRLAQDGKFTLVISSPILAELNEVILRPRLIKCLGSNPVEAAAEYTRALLTAGQLAQNLPTVDVVKTDAKDNHIIAAAMTVQADYIVSGDKRDLLPLGQIKMWLAREAREHIIHIVPPRDFLTLLQPTS